MTGIPAEVAMHHLNVDPKAKPIKQKLRVFGPEKDAITKEEVQKLLEAVHVRRIQFTIWLSNAILVVKAEGK